MALPSLPVQRWRRCGPASRLPPFPPATGAQTILKRLLLSGIVLLLLYVLALAGIGLLSRPAPAAYAVVLGNELTRDGRPSPRLQARLDTALGLVRAGLVPRVLVSGGVEQPGSRNEAASMAHYLEAAGIPADAIVQDPAGATTADTARNAARLLALDEPIVVVTQWFHIPRATLAMRHAGFAHVSAAWPRYVEARDLYSFAREAIALPAYALRFWRP